MPIATPGLTNFTGGAWSRRLDGRVDLQKYFNACRTLTNFHPHPHGGATRRSGFRFIQEAKNGAARVLLIPFEFNSQQTYILEFGDEGSAGYMRVFKDQGIVLSGGTPYSIVSPYLAADLPDVRWVQSNDTLFLVHPNYAPRKLTRTGHASWTFSTITFTSQPEKWGTGNWPSLVTLFENRLVFAATPNEPSTIWMSRTNSYYDFRLCTREVPLDGWSKCKITDDNTDGKKDGKEGDKFKVAKAELFSYDDTFLYAVKGETPAGVAQYFQYLGTRSYDAASGAITVTFKDTVSTTGEIESIYNSSGVLQSTYWSAHAVGDFIDYDQGDPLDSDAIELTIGSDGGSAAIYWMVSKEKLWLGTNSGTWTVGGSGVNTAILPSSIKASHHDTKGATESQALPIGAAALFIQMGQKKLLEMAYRFQDDSFVTNDMTVLSENIGSELFTKLAYCQDPDSRVYALRGDGKLAALTYMRDQEVISWSLQDTTGVIEDIAAIYGTTDNRTELWAVVKRTLPSGDKRYIELLEADFDADDTTDAFFVDCGATYDGTAATTLTGLSHLEGLEVDILADGAVHPARTVSSGAVTLAYPASVVHVGLPYTSTLETMRIEAGSAAGTSQTKIKRIIKAAIRFWKTLGGKFGPSTSRLDTIYSRSSANNMDEAPALFTGDKIVQFPQGWNKDNIIVIQQDQPLPMTVLMIVPEVEVNG